MKFFIWIKGLFEEKDGTPSSKRVQSFLLFILAAVMVFTVGDPVLVGIVFGAALGLQGVTSFQR